MRARIAAGGRALVVVAVVGWACAGAPGGSITGLNFDVAYNGVALGDVRLHVGTHDFTAAGRDGIGRATAGGEQSGFRPLPGATLGDAYALAGFDHLNWLQLVTAQPAAHNAPFGPPPHCDPSDAPGNPTPRDNDPWYLNEIVPLNPPFDMPPATAGLLEFQDFPNAVPWNLNEAFSADVYLVGVLDVAARTYTSVAAFTWTIVKNRVGGEVRVRMTELAEIEPVPSAAYRDLVSAYAGQGWTYVPEPGAAWLVLVALVVVRRR